jgi:hypothetical protein
MLEGYRGFNRAMIPWHQQIGSSSQEIVNIRSKGCSVYSMTYKSGKKAGESSSKLMSSQPLVCGWEPVSIQLYRAEPVAKSWRCDYSFKEPNS